MSGRAEAAMRLVRAAARSNGLGQRTDPELLAAFLAGEPDAFEMLVRRHGPLVLQTCRQAARCEADAEDAFQATFVQLYQRAASIRNRPSVAGWLFRVARRSAANARRATVRRERREARTSVPANPLPPDVSWCEACTILHEELDRLPDRYRLPLLLCYLQGLSRDEAARRLGWTVNEVRGRLERGRSRLRARLCKRGVTLSAGLLTAVGTLALPGGLVARTLAAARTASPAVAASLLWKGAVTVTIAATLVLGLAVQDRGAQAQPPSAAPAIPAAKAEPDAPKPTTVSGRVVGPDGKPVAGAKVYVRHRGENDGDRPVTRTDGEGKFTVPVPAVAHDERTTVGAAAAGLAAGWRTWWGPPPDDVTITLAKDDLPVAGRILDLEGKPVAGVTVAVNAVHEFPEDGPKAYVEWLSGLRGRPTHNTFFGVPPGATARATTAADGRFRLIGIGRDRAVHIVVTGPGIAYESIAAVTVPAFDARPAPRAGKVYPATFDHLAAPARPIRGTARDADTGKPVAGLHINGLGSAATTVTTDQDGRYELPGYKKGPKYTVYARPADGGRYFPAQAVAADRAGLDPLVIDLKAQAGVPVSGRVVETTGKPVAGSVRYYALAGNPNVGQIPVGDFYTQEVAIRPDGQFTVAALPGPGFLAVTAKGHYPAARVDPTGFFKDAVNPRPTTDHLPINVGGGALTTVSQDGFQAIVLLDVDKARPPGEQRIELTPAEPIRGRLLDPDGKPLTGVRVRGLREAEEDWSPPLGPAEFTAAPPHPDRPRRLAFRHEGRKLVGTAVVAAGSAKPVEFKLEPSGTVGGRLLDIDGRPIARAQVYAAAGKGADGKMVDTVRSGNFHTDADGRFRVDGLLPGLAYDVWFRETKPKGRGGPVAKAVSVKSGEARDLGDLKPLPVGP